MRRILIDIAMAIVCGVSAFAQCAMCKSSVETSNNPAFITALRDGIYMMLVTPYLIAAVIAAAVFVRWRRRQRLLSSRPSLN